MNILQILTNVQSNPFYRSAVEADPEYQRAIALRTAAQQTLLELPSVPATTPPNNPDDIPAWLKQVAKTHTQADAINAQRDALNHLIASTASTITSSVNMFGDRILSSLAAELRSLMQDVAAVVERLKGARTPDEVIAARVGDAWSELPTLRDAYDSIRTAQQLAAGADVSLSQSRYIDDPHASLLYIRNLDDVFPGWNVPAQHPVTITVHGPNAGEPDPRPWPTEPVAQLIWLVTSDVEVWLPTSVQLNELRKERHARFTSPEVAPTRFSNGGLINR